MMTLLELQFLDGTGCAYDVLLVTHQRGDRHRTLGSFENCDSGGSHSSMARWVGLRRLARSWVVAELEDRMWFAYRNAPTEEHRIRRLFVCGGAAGAPRCYGPFVYEVESRTEPALEPDTPLREGWTMSRLLPGEGDVRARAVLRAQRPGLLRFELVDGVWETLSAATTRPALRFPAGLSHARYLRVRRPEAPDASLPTSLVVGTDAADAVLDELGTGPELCARFAQVRARCAVQRLGGPWVVVLTETGTRRIGVLARHDGRGGLRPVARVLDRGSVAEAVAPVAVRRRGLGAGYVGFVFEDQYLDRLTEHLLVFDGRLERAVAMVPLSAESLPAEGAATFVERSEAVVTLRRGVLAMRLQAGSWSQLFDAPDMTMSETEPYLIELPGRP
ncbi:MAG: hypothetical protein AAF447_02955 [Myxococcota bacterium]